MDNPWVAWLDSRKKKPAWYWMHKVHGTFGNDQACRGCAWLEQKKRAGMVGFYTTNTCTKFPHHLEVNGRRWQLNWPACGLWKKREKK